MSMAVERDGAEPAGGGDASANTFKVYTRTGDEASCLFNMERRDKDDAVFEALGDVDELGVAVGIANVFALECDDPACAPISPSSPSASSRSNRLLGVGAPVATPLDASSDWKKARVAFDDHHVDRLEAWIDEYDARLPPLKNFILPGGGRRRLSASREDNRQESGATRRADGQRGDVAPVIGRYLNRLSDFLYTAARCAAAVWARGDQLSQGVTRRGKDAVEADGRRRGRVGEYEMGIRSYVDFNPRRTPAAVPVSSRHLTSGPNNNAASSSTVSTNASKLPSHASLCVRAQRQPTGTIRRLAPRRRPTGSLPRRHTARVPIPSPRTAPTDRPVRV